MGPTPGSGPLLCSAGRAYTVRLLMEPTLALPLYTMSNRSPRAIEREFFRAFFAALVEQGKTSVNWRDESTSARFRDAVEWLEHELTTSTGEPGGDMQTLLLHLRPDPLTGATVALDRALMDLQFSDVSVSNPSYEKVKLLVTPSIAKRILGALPETEQRLYRGMAEVFLAEEHERRRAV